MLARGIYYFNELGSLFTVWDNYVYKDSTKFITLTTTIGRVGFTEAVYGLKRYLFIADGKKAYLIDSSNPTTFTQIDSSFVILATVTDGGSGYVAAPTITINAPSIPAWSGVTSYALNTTVTNSGNVYICVDSGTSGITGPTGTSIEETDGTCSWRYLGSLTDATATATCTIASGAVTEITIVNPGFGYSSAPTLTFSSGSASAVVTLSGFPDDHIPTPVFLDGYIFLAKKDTPDIYNSGIGDYDYWNPIDYLSVSQYPDTIKALAKQNNQIAVLKEDTLEFVYDAANAYGSPLSRTTQAIVQVGCVSYTAVADHERKVFFVGQSSTGTAGVWSIEGFKDQKISTEAIDRILADEGSYLSLADGYNIRTAGHFFYVLRLYGGRTLVYDVEENFWHEWTSVVNNIEGNFFGNYATTINTQAILQHYNNGKTYAIDPNEYTDPEGVIKVSWTSIPIDMENTYRKWFQSLSFVGDQQTSQSDLKITCSDDDYKTWNNGWTINLQERAYIKKLGSSRRRAFKLEHEADTPFRMEALELVYSQGEH